jgi:hypothetical protein
LNVKLDPATVLFDGKPVTWLLTALSTGNEREREAAAGNLSFVYIGLPRPGMRSGLPDWVLRTSDYCKQRAEVLVPLMVNALGDRWERVRLAAINTLATMHWHAAAARPALEACLGDEHSEIRAAAREALELLSK